MLLVWLAACNPDKDGVDTTDPGDDTQTDAPECTGDVECGDGAICEDEVCVDGDRNNAPEEAEALLWEDGVTGVINPDDDVDYYAFEADGGEYIVVTTTLGEDVTGDEGYDTVVTIREANGKVVTSASTFATGTSVGGIDAMAFAYLEQAGTYVIAVEDIGSASGGSGYGDPDYAYTLTLEEWSEATDEADSAEDPSSTVDLSEARVWTSVGTLVDEPGDADWIGFAHVLEGQNLYVDGNQDLSGSDLTPLVRLWSADGLLLGEKASVGPEEYLFYPHLAEGDYVVEVTDTGGDGGSNAWTFSHFIVRADTDGLEFAEEAEPNGDIATATALPQADYENGDGNPYSQAQGLGWIDEDGDEDWFLLEDTWDGGGLVLCLVSGVYGSLVAPTVEIYDGAGTQLASDDGSAAAYPTANIDNVDTDGQPLYVRVTGDVAGPGAWYRFYVYTASFTVSDYADGGYGCP